MIVTSKICKPTFLRNFRRFSALSSSSSHLRSHSALASCWNPAIPSSQFAQIPCGRPFSTSTKNCQSNTPQRQMIPPLMDFEELVWPSVLKTIKNFFFVNLIIRPYFDSDFELREFVNGSKQALELISNTIGSDTNLDGLTGLVTQDAIQEIKRAVSRMSVTQRNKFLIKKDDVFFCFPQQIGIMFEESDSVQKRWVEITMVYHVLQGYSDLQARQEPVSLNLAADSQYHDKFSICNYRFIKEFTTGQHSDWVVNCANHFNPSEKVRDGN